MSHDTEFILILNHTVRIGRRNTFSTTVMGQRRQTGETEIGTGVSCYFYLNAGKKIQTQSGDFRIADFTGMFKYTQDIQEGDLITPQAGITGFTLGTVLDVEPIMDFDGLTHHVEAHVKKLG